MPPPCNGDVAGDDYASVNRRCFDEDRGDAYMSAIYLSACNWPLHTRNMLSGDESDDGENITVLLDILIKFAYDMPAHFQIVLRPASPLYIDDIFIGAQARRHSDREPGPFIYFISRAFYGTNFDLPPSFSVSNNLGGGDRRAHHFQMIGRHRFRFLDNQ